MLRVLDVATGEQVEGPIDRARYSPVAWLPGGEAYYYVRRLDPAGLPEAERQYHRRVWLHRVGSDPRHGRRDLRRGPRHPQLLRRLGLPRRPLADGLGGDRHGTAQRRVDRAAWRGPIRPRRRSPSSPSVSTRTSARGSGGTGGSTWPPTSTRRAGGSPSPRRPTRVRRPGATCSRRTPRRCSRTSPCSTERSSATGRCCWRRGPGTPSRRSACTSSRPATACRRGRDGAAARARFGRRPDQPARGRARDVVLVHRPHDPAARVPLRRARRIGRAVQQPARRRRRRARRLGPAGRVSVQGRDDGPHVRADPRRPGRRRRIADAAPARGPLRLRRVRRPADPGVLGVHPRVGRGGRRLRDREPARRRRGGRGVAPRRDAREQAERLRRLPRGGRDARRAGLDDVRAARDQRRVERRVARRRGADAAARSSSRR